MARLIDRLIPVRGEGRAAAPLSWNSLQDLFSYNGLGYSVFGNGSYGKTEGPSFTLRQAITNNGIVFGVVDRRVSMFSQARFAYRDLSSAGMPTLNDLDRTNVLLRPLAKPQRVLRRMEWDVADGGNAFVILNSRRELTRLNPEWVSIVHGSHLGPDEDPDAYGSDSELIGYVYDPPTGRPETFLAENVAHYAPYPDPTMRSRGMSWVEPVLAEVDTDAQSRMFVRQFYNNAATPNYVVTLDASLTVEKARQFKELFEEDHAGVSNAFRTLVLAGGAKPTVVGSKLSDLDSEGVTRLLHAAITVAGGVPAIVTGVIPGLESSTFANYTQAFRSFGDLTVRTLWGEAALALSNLVGEPEGFELFTDSSGIAAMQNDAKDDADILTNRATTMRTLVDGGFDPETVIDAVTTGDLSRLVHSGKTSVQLMSNEDAPVDAGDSRSAEESAADLAAKVNALGILIRSAFEPADALRAVGLSEIKHLGLLPITVQSPETVEAEAVQAEGEADAISEEADGSDDE